MQTSAEVQTQILLKVENDPEFRTRLAADPRGVIEEETGLTVPDGQLVLVEEAIANAQRETPSIDTPLTREELLQVMGGDCGNGNPEPDAPWYCGD